MRNLKDTVTTICSIVLIISGGILAAVSAGAVLPVYIVAGATASASISGGLIGYFTGKNPNGTTKQIDPSTGQQSTSAAAVESATK